MGPEDDRSLMLLGETLDREQATTLQHYPLPVGVGLLCPPLHFNMNMTFEHILTSLNYCHQVWCEAVRFPSDGKVVSDDL